MRPANEDQFLIAELNRSLLIEQTTLPLHARTRLFGRATAKLLVVADGIGGHAHGDLASSLAVQTVTRCALITAPCLFASDESVSETVLCEQLSHALLSCQRAMDADAERRPEHRQMGTTLTMGCIVWPNLYVVHAGDSRCYLLRRGALHRLTRDHTAAQELVDAGIMTEEATSRTPFAHVLSNAIIARDDGEVVHPEVRRTELSKGDTVVLCTDGLTLHLSEGEIARIVSSARSAGEACELLVRQANEAGGRDNITVAIGRVVAVPASDPARDATCAGLDAV